MESKAYLVAIFLFSCYLSNAFGAVVNNSKFNLIQSDDSIKKSSHDKTWKRSADHEKSEYYDEYYHEPEEPECEDGHYYHIRGLRCVPFDCPGGNQFRNKHTGECILKKYGVTESEKSRPLRGLNRMKNQNKFRLPFGLTLKG